MWTVQTLVPNNTVPIACTMQRTTVQNTANSAAKKTFTSKKLASCGRRPGRCSVLTSCPVVARTHFVPVIPLRWVTNSSNAQHTTLHYFASRVWRPFASSLLQMASCREAKYEGAGKASSADHVAALSNAQRNATHPMPRNTVVEFFFSIFLIRS